MDLTGIINVLVIFAGSNFSILILSWLDDAVGNDIYITDWLTDWLLDSQTSQSELITWAQTGAKNAIPNYLRECQKQFKDQRCNLEAGLLFKLFSIFNINHSLGCVLNVQQPAAS